MEPAEGSVIVGVHLSFPWVTDTTDFVDDPTEVQEEAAIIIKRLVLDPRPLYLLGPTEWGNRRVPPAVTGDLDALCARAVDVADGSLVKSFMKAAAYLGDRLPRAPVLVTGFWRDMCCSAACDIFLEHGCLAVVDKDLTRAAPY